MLTNRQRVFVEEYLRCWNACEAARRAGYARADKAGARVLHWPAVEQLVQQRIAEKAMGADEVLLRLAEIARGDMGDFLADDGSIDIARARLAGKTHLIKVYSDARIELHDALAALEKLGKHLGMFRDRVEVSGPGGGPLVVINWDGTEVDIGSDTGTTSPGAESDP